jgi:uncharacterized protein YndB with AHSA1/START domain
MTSASDGFDMVLTRTFDAPKERVWRAWSDAEEVMRWLGPGRLHIADVPHGLPRGRHDPRLNALRARLGPHNTWTYRSIEPMDRIEFAQGFADEYGNRVAPADIGLPLAIPAEVPHVVTLRSIDDATTEVTVHEFGYPDETVEISRTGMEQCLDKMEAGLTAT